MGMSDGKLVPRRFAGSMLGRRTMQDDDNASGFVPPPSGSVIITEGGNNVITEGGDQIVTE